jgi:hypothetical protein
MNTVQNVKKRLKSADHLQVLNIGQGKIHKDIVVQDLYH